MIRAILFFAAAASAMPAAADDDARLWKLATDTQSLYGLATDALANSDAAFEALAETRGRIEATLGTGGPDALAEARAAWLPTRDAVDTIIGRRAELVAAHEAQSTIGAAARQLVARLDEVARILVETAADPEAASRVYHVARTQRLLDRLARRVDEALEGSAATPTIIDNIGRDAKLVEVTLDAFVTGNDELEISRIAEARAAALISEVRTLYAAQGEAIDALLDASADLIAAGEALKQLRAHGEVLAAALSIAHARASKGAAAAAAARPGETGG